jgi:AbrB family looped-hinge helix DNA binding protein
MVRIAMAKVTSKLQVTIPKRIADRYGIEPGDEIDWVEAGDAIRVLPAGEPRDAVDVPRRIELFDAATVRQRARQVERPGAPVPRERGWSREDLYARGRAG